MIKLLIFLLLPVMSFGQSIYFSIEYGNNFSRPFLSEDDLTRHFSGAFTIDIFERKNKYKGTFGESFGAGIGYKGKNDWLFEFFCKTKERGVRSDYFFYFPGVYNIESYPDGFGGSYFTFFFFTFEYGVSIGKEFQISDRLKLNSSVQLIADLFLFEARYGSNILRFNGNQTPLSEYTARGYLFDNYTDYVESNHTDRNYRFGLGCEFGANYSILSFLDLTLNTNLEFLDKLRMARGRVHPVQGVVFDASIHLGLQFNVGL